MTLDIRINQRRVAKAFQKAPDDTKRTIDKILDYAELTTVREMRKRASVGVSGELRRKVRGKRTNGGQAVDVRSESEYAPHVEYGTRPHWPPYQPGTPLYDWANAKGIAPFAVALGISRKGTKAQHFVRDTFNEVETPIKRYANIQIDKLTRSIQ